MERDPVDERPPIRLPEGWPEDIKVARLTHWTPVTWVIGLWTAGPPSRDTPLDLLAMKRVVLPRAPVAGDQFEFRSAYATVEHARWRGRPDALGHCTCRLNNAVASEEFLAELEQDGWTVVPAADADEAFRSLLS